MSDLNCYITTFNCGREVVNIDYFASNFFNGAKLELPPDFIVLCLQEVAPLGYSFLGGSLLAPYYACFTQAVLDATASRFGEDKTYGSVITREVGMTAIMVFARQEVQPRIRWVETGGVGVGVLELGNKGAVGVRVGVKNGDGDDETRLSFVAAHLAPMEEKWQQRNEDWQTICENLVFERIPTIGQSIEQVDPIGEGESEPLLSSRDDAASSEPSISTMFDPPSYLFFAGDLNYRTSDEPPSPDDPKSWPQPAEKSSDPQHYSNFLPKDQLSREKAKGNTLHHLAEAPVAFPPTYKYSKAAQKQVAHTTRSKKRTQADGRVNEITYIKPQGDEEDVWLWAEHRVPSWCDRILFLNEARPTVHSYTALPVQPTSDHRPVALSCSVSPKKMGEVSMPSHFEVREDWKERRAAARRYEIAVGLGAYLGLTWEGEALLLGTVVGIIGGYLILRTLLAS